MSMEINCKPGTVVIFTANGGYDSGVLAQERGFVIGNRYTVKAIHVGGWSTSVEFEEIGGSWNSVMFRDVVPGMTPVWIHSESIKVSEFREEEDYGSWSREIDYRVHGASLQSYHADHEYHSSEEFSVPDRYAVVGGEVYVLWFTYSTGDSFGRSTGDGELMWVFGSEELARAAEQFIKKNPHSDSIEFLGEMGEVLKLSNPTSGYFEDLMDTHITKLVLK